MSEGDEPPPPTPLLLLLQLEAGGGGGGAGGCRVTLHAASCPVSAVAPAGIDPGEKPRVEGVRSGAARIYRRVRFLFIYFSSATRLLLARTDESCNVKLRSKGSWNERKG